MLKYHYYYSSCYYYVYCHYYVARRMLRMRAYAELFLRSLWHGSRRGGLGFRGLGVRVYRALGFRGLGV